MSRIVTARVRAIALLAAVGALVAAGATGGVGGLRPKAATASSHREAPLIAGQPQFDNTDVYAFVSPDKPDMTTFIANWVPFEEPAGGPNFYKFATDGAYDINVDTDGDAKPNLTFRWTFAESYRNRNTFLYNTGAVTSLNDPDLNYRQTYDLTLMHRVNGVPVKQRKLANDAPVAPSRVGNASMPNYGALRDQAVWQLPSGGHVFAGQADDPFFLDLRVFDLLYGGNQSEVGNDTLRGYNVNTVALQVPTKMLKGDSPDDPVIGVYSSTFKNNAQGGWTQVSRLGMPLVNEVVIPVKDKDKFNASKPWHDAQFGKYVTNPELPKLIQGIYKIPAPKEPRDDLVQVFLTGVPKLNQPAKVRPAELLRLNTAIPPTAKPKRLGVLDGDIAGYPNGRRLTDDVVDISLQVVEGELVGAKNDLGDAVNVNDQSFSRAFPYLALPTSGSAVRGGASSGTKRSDDSGGKSGVSMINGGKVSAVPVAGRESEWPIVPLLAGGALGVATLSGGLISWFIRRRRLSSL
jgi:Domain of unknown function (DUF4331)